MTELEYRQVRTLLADRNAFAALDPSTLTEAQRSALVRGLRARGRAFDARRVEGKQ